MQPSNFLEKKFDQTSSMNDRKERRCIFIGVKANDLDFGGPSIFPEEEVTNNYLLGYGPPLGEDWPNSDDEPAKGLVPETPEQSMPTNEALPTTILSDSSESVRFLQAPRRNRIREAARRVSF